jgi:hypothetical protein
MKNVNHYGKSLNELTKVEKELLETDLQLSNIFNDINKCKEDNIEKVVLMSVSEVFIEKRNKLCCTLLGIEMGDNEMENILQIESTQYSYEGFLNDLKENCKSINEFENGFSLN